MELDANRPPQIVKYDGFFPDDDFNFVFENVIHKRPFIEK